MDLVSDTTVRNDNQYLTGYFTRFMIHLNNIREIGPVELALYMQTPALGRINSALLCGYALRYKELTALKTAWFMDGGTYYIKQFKTSSMKAIDTRDLAVILKDVPPSIVSNALVISYESLERYIARACQSCRIDLGPGVKDRTHIWRHLRASWLLYDGNSKSTVSKVLGHTDPSSVSAYTHNYKKLMDCCKQR